MSPDGVISLQLRFEWANGRIGDALWEYKPGDKNYKNVMDHLGGITPGEEKSIPLLKSGSGRVGLMLRGRGFYESRRLLQPALDVGSGFTDISLFGGSPLNNGLDQVSLTHGEHPMQQLAIYRKTC
jgi:hypothetical protein